MKQIKGIELPASFVVTVSHAGTEILPTAPVETDILTVAEVAELLKCNKSSIYNLTRNAVAMIRPCRTWVPLIDLLHNPLYPMDSICNGSYGNRNPRSAVVLREFPSRKNRGGNQEHALASFFHMSLAAAMFCEIATLREIFQSRETYVHVLKMRRGVSACTPFDSAREIVPNFVPSTKPDGIALTSSATAAIA